MSMNFFVAAQILKLESEGVYFFGMKLVRVDGDLSALTWCHALRIRPTEEKRGMRKDCTQSRCSLVLRRREKTEGRTEKKTLEMKREMRSFSLSSTARGHLLQLIWVEATMESIWYDHTWFMIPPLQALFPPLMFVCCLIFRQTSTRDVNKHKSIWEVTVESLQCGRCYANVEDTGVSKTQTVPSRNCNWVEERERETNYNLQWVHHNKQVQETEIIARGKWWNTQTVSQKKDVLEEMSAGMGFAGWIGLPQSQDWTVEVFQSEAWKAWKFCSNTAVGIDREQPWISW